MNALYDAAMARILACGDVRVKVCKTQLSFYARYAFAFLSAGPRKGTVRLSFGLRREMHDPRISAMAHPAPGRWTYHIDLRGEDGLDAQVDAWLAEAYAVCGMAVGRKSAN